MQVVLVMFRSDGERRSFSVTREVTIVGRREDCDLRIPLSDVSRKHCRVIKDGDTLRLEDLGSSNGTFVNGQRVREATLSAGDTLSVGPVHFGVCIDGAPSEAEIQLYSATGSNGEVLDSAELEPAELDPADLIESDAPTISEDDLIDIDSTRNG